MPLKQLFDIYKMLSEADHKVWSETVNSTVRNVNGDLLGYKCRFCDKQIVRQDYFKLHLKRQHYMFLKIEKPPKNEKCTYNQCEFCCYTKSELKSHVKNKHTKTLAKACTATNHATNFNQSVGIGDETLNSEQLQLHDTSLNISDDMIEYLNDDDVNEQDNGSEVTSSTDGLADGIQNDGIEADEIESAGYVQTSNNLLTYVMYDPTQQMQFFDIIECINDNDSEDTSSTDACQNDAGNVGTNGTGSESGSVENAGFASNSHSSAHDNESSNASRIAKPREETMFTKMSEQQMKETQSESQRMCKDEKDRHKECVSSSALIRSADSQNDDCLFESEPASELLPSI